MTSTTTMTTTTKVESKSALKTLPMTENIQDKKKKKRGDDDDDDDMKRVRILDGPDPIVKSEDASILTSSQETKRLDTDISSYEEERRILLDGVAESLSNVISQMARANERLNIKSTELKSKFMNIDNNNKHRNRNQRRNAKNRNVVNDDTRKMKMMMMKQYVTLGNCREMEEVATVWREAFRADNNASEGENSTSGSSSSSVEGGGGGGLPRERVKNVDQRLSLSRSFRGTLNRSSSSVASMTTSFR